MPQTPAHQEFPAAVQMRHCCAPQLIMNVDCTDTAECAEAGAMLFNSSSRTKLTDGLARQGISLLPGTFQVGGAHHGRSSSSSRANL